MRRFPIVVVLLLAATLSNAQKGPKYPIRQFTLPNGLRVIISEDHSVPVVGLALAYDVGSRDEVTGRTGFAHLFEHLMFQGSAHVPRGGLDKMIAENGGLSNAFTREEDTTYIETFPSNKLPMALWLEADRMRSLQVTAENLKNQQEVVKEEKRLRYDNQPYVQAESEALQNLAYSRFPNQHTVIGSMQDIDAASLADVQSFFKEHYAPNNGVLVLVGDLNPKEVQTLATRLFGDIPRQPAPRKPDLAEPMQTVERRTTVTDKLARLPAIAVAWHGTSYGNADTYAMDLLSEILFDGEASRAYQDLVKGKQMAVSINGGLNSMRGPSLFELFTVYRPNVSESDMEGALYAQIDAIKEKPPTQSELNRVKTQLRASRYRSFSIFGLESMMGRAIQIADYAVFQGDPNLVNTEIDRYMAVTPAQIQAVARKYFTQENRTVVVIQPGASTPTGPQGGAR